MLIAVSRAVLELRLHIEQWAQPQRFLLSGGPIC